VCVVGVGAWGGVVGGVWLVGVVGGGWGGKSSTTFTFSVLFAMPILLPICRIPAFSISCRFPGVRSVVCLAVAARRLAVLLLPL